MKWLRFRLIFSTLIERIVFFTTNAFLQDMEYSRQSDYNTKIFRGCQCQWQSLALDKRGTCTCTGRVTAQGNKDTMTTMVVVIRGGRANLHKIKRDGGQIAQPRSQTLICGEWEFKDTLRTVNWAWQCGDNWLQWRRLWSLSYSAQINHIDIPPVSET